MPECRGDGLGWIVLPGLRLESDDAPALLDDGDAGETVERAARAKIIDGEADRLRARRRAELARDTDDRRCFQKGAGHAAMDCGEDRIADDLLRERHHEAAILAHADA